MIRVQVSFLLLLTFLQARSEDVDVVYSNSHVLVRNVLVVRTKKQEKRTSPTGEVPAGLKFISGTYSITSYSLFVIEGEKRSRVWTKTISVPKKLNVKPVFSALKILHVANEERRLFILYISESRLYLQMVEKHKGVWIGRKTKDLGRANPNSCKGTIVPTEGCLSVVIDDLVKGKKSRSIGYGEVTGPDETTEGK